MKVLGLLFAAIAGCYAATTVELLAANPNESQLVALVQAAGLVDTLNAGKHLFIYLHRLVGKQTKWFPNRPDTNRPE